MIVWGLFITTTLLGTFWSVATLLFDHLEDGIQLTLIFNCLEVGLGLLLVSLSAPTALAEERVRGSLDVLLTTPLTTRSIVSGKWWAMYRVVPRLVILTAFALIVLSLEGSDAYSSQSRTDLDTGPHGVRGRPRGLDSWRRGRDRELRPLAGHVGSPRRPQPWL